MNYNVSFLLQLQSEFWGLYSGKQGKNKLCGHLGCIQGTWVNLGLLGESSLELQVTRETSFSEYLLSLRVFIIRHIIMAGT